MASWYSHSSFMCMLLFFTVVASAVQVHEMSIDDYVNYINPPAVDKFQNEHGDSILCVKYTDQISLSPNRNYQPNNSVSEQMSMINGKMKPGLNFSNDSVKKECPESTVTIMEIKREHVERAGSVAQFISKRNRFANANTNTLHEYGVAHVSHDQPIIGANATFTVWQPYVDPNGFFSLSQMWIVSDGSWPVETIEVGWQVFPTVFDTQPRLFVYWTADGYNQIGCYNTNCPGFVVAPGAPMYPGQPINPVSTYNGEQIGITINVQKEDADNGERWDLYVNDQLIGWWPSSLYNHLQDVANTVEFGGEVAFMAGPQGTPLTKTEMGSGHFSSEGFGRAAHIRDMQISSVPGMPINTDAQIIVGRPTCYDASLVVDNEGKHLLFGGPGGDNPGCVV